MKTILLILSLLFISSTANAQLWKEMMNDPSVNVYDVVIEAEKHFESIDITKKGSGWKGYQRWLYETEPKFYPSGDRSSVDPYFVKKASEGFTPSSAMALFDGGWEELGPHYLEQITGHYSAGLGRVESYYSDPTDPLKIYLGSRSGGFWRTVDGGVTWTESTTDFLFATGVNTMSVSPTDSDSIYINVRNSRNGTTHGIHLSTDGGDTWNVTNFNPTNLLWGGMGTNRQIYQIAHHPTIPGLIFIGTNEGLFRSADNLTTWTAPVTALDFQTIAFHPTNPDIIYAYTLNNSSAIYISTNGGLTFSLSNTIPGNGAWNTKISISAACPNCVYVGSSDGIWKSTDEGINFTLLSTPGISNYGAYAVSDVDTNIMLFGNIDVHMSSDEGQTFNQATYWSQGNANYNTTGTYVHADIRGATCVNGVFWINTDGFLCRSFDNGVTWEIFEGQSIREYYNLGVSQSNHERTITGSQDNGTSIKTETSWVEFYGADGMEGIIHPLNDDWMIGSVQYGGRRRTKDGGQSQDGATPPNQNGGWIAPLFYDPNDHMKVYHMGDTIYRSDDFGSSWTKLGTPSFSGTISYATVAETNSERLIVARGQDIEKSLDGGLTFQDIQGTLPNSSISDIAFDPNDDWVIVVTYASYQANGEKVFITTNQGITWQNITYNLNDMPIRSVVIDHTNESTIYLGTEIGVYKKAMADNSWSLYNPDLPNTSIIEMEVMYGSNTLRAVTWGRGLWEFTLDGRQSYPSITNTSITDMPTDQAPLFGIDQFVNATILYDNTISSVYVEWSVNAPTFGNAISMTNTGGNDWISSTSLPNQPAGTKLFFKVFAVGDAGDTTETYKFMYTTKPFDYCASFGNMSYSTGITLVDFNTINNPTGKLQGYTDYTATDSTIVELGSSHDLTLNVDTDGNYITNAKAWIDWNHDADFEDVGEEYDLGFGQNTPDGITDLSPLTITVPLTAWVGKTTMRVSGKYNTDPLLCQEGFDGEVEDYSIYVAPICNPVNSYSTISACNSLSWNGSVYTSTGTYATVVSNIYGCDSTAYVDLTIENSSSIDTRTECEPFTWIDGNVYSSSNNSATFTLPNAAGCDSLVTLDLTVELINTNVNTNGVVLTTVTTSNAYQWVDCDANYAPIAGETNASFIPTVNGNYAVIVDSAFCSDTSACFTINTIGIGELSSEVVLISPNPSSGQFSIQFDAVKSNVNVVIYSQGGRILRNESFVNRAEIPFDLSVANGAYYVVVRIGGKNGVFKLVITE
jgi:hypothetical protein